MYFEHLFIGIDVSKLKHDIAIMNQHKKLLRKPFVITDSYEGYCYLVRVIKQLCRQYNVAACYIGLESTSDYWKNIYYFLKKQSDTFVLTVINPIRTKAFAKTELRRANTDKVAAKDIAQFLVEKKPAPSFDRQPIVDCIKDLDGQLYAVKKQLSMTTNKLRIELTKKLKKTSLALKANKYWRCLKNSQPLKRSPMHRWINYLPSTMAFITGRCQ
jgi:transposase